MDVILGLPAAGRTWDKPPKKGKLQMEAKELAALIKRCAEAQDDADKEPRQPERWKGVAGEWSTEGHNICVRIAGEQWGYPIYIMLAGAWNDILGWAERELAK